METKRVPRAAGNDFLERDKKDDRTQIYLLIKQSQSIREAFKKNQKKNLTFVTSRLTPPLPHLM